MDELGGSYPPDNRQEHCTTRVDNTYLIDEVREYGKTLRVSGEAIQNIREESRRIYMQDGVPGIFFDLEESATFLQMCKTKNAIKIEEYLFTPQDLNLDGSINTNIDVSIKQFQEKVLMIDEKNKSNSSLDFGSAAHVIAGSKMILENLTHLVHVQGFLVQQNRDLYREMCEHLCREMRESEHATYIRTKLREDLNRALDADDYGIGYGVNEKILAGVMKQIISTLQTHDKLEISREYDKKYRQYTRKIVKKARDEMKINIKDVWRANQGDDVEIVKRRDNSLKNIQDNFNYKTNWDRMKYEYDSMNGVGVQTSQEFERKMKETKEKKESEKQLQKDKIQNLHEEYTRNEKEKEKEEAFQRKNRQEVAKQNLFVLQQKTNKDQIRFSKECRKFYTKLYNKYVTIISERSMRQSFFNDCEQPCTSEINKMMDVNSTKSNLIEYFLKSLKNMHVNVINKISQAGIDVNGVYYDIIKYYFDTTVYMATEKIDFGNLNVDKRKNRIENKGIIMREFHTIMQNNMDKFEANNIPGSMFSPLNYNPYVI